ncbi:MAG: YdeI/OmpD-associated family protein [Pseudomonadota bacterium]
MSKNLIPNGEAHELPEDFKNALLVVPQALETWHNITPLARTEWIAWVEDAKKAETRDTRMKQGISNLSEGKRRPCCWPGYKNVGKYKKQKK